MRISYLAVAAGAVAFLCARPASANGRFPQSNQVVFSATDPNLVIARTTYGILPSHDNGATWSFLCEDAVGLGGATADPEIGLTSGNALIASVASPPGLNISPDVGCTWSCAAGPLSNQSFVDLAVRPDAMHSVVTLTSTYRAADAGGRSSQVFESTDDGATWNALGVPIPDPLFQAETIDVAKTDHQRIYVSGASGLAPNRTASVWVSRNGGMTWTETRLPSPSLFDPTAEDSVFIGGVDPTNADRLYLRSKSLLQGGLSRMSMSTDGAGTFQVLQSFDIGMPQNSSELGEFLGFALSADGSKIYAGTREQGLWVASRSDMTFHQLSKIHIFCLATRGDELWVCSDAGSTFATLGFPFVLGMTTDDGATFTSKMSSVQCMTGPIVCSGAQTTLGCHATVSGAHCEGPYNMFCANENDPSSSCNCGTGDDGGAGATGDASAGGDGGVKGPPSRPSSGGCSLVGGGGTAGVLASGVVAILALGRRRRRR